MKNVLVVGDSWASAVVAGNAEHGGWPQILDVPQELRQGVAGTTAAQWASDFEERLTKASQTPCEKVVVSLCGNDVIAAMQDGVVTPQEIATLLQNFAVAMSPFSGKKIFILGYADPFCGRDLKIAIAVMILNSALAALCLSGDATFVGVQDVLTSEHFNGADIHPNLAGHEAIAKKVAQVVEGV